MHYLDAVELVYLESWIFEEDLNIIYLLVLAKPSLFCLISLIEEVPGVARGL